MLAQHHRSPASCLTVFAVVFLLHAGPSQGELFYAVGADVDGSSQLYRVDADTGVATISGPVEASSPRILSLTTHSDGQLYGVATENGFIVLHRIDPATGSITEVGAVEADTAGSSDLSLASLSKGLLLTDGTVIYGVDPATGFSTPPAFLPRSVETLAVREGQIYAITRDGELGAGTYRIEELDFDTLTLNTLSSFATEDEGLRDAAFDAAGRLRLVTVGGSIISSVNLGYFRIDDLADPELVETARAIHHFEDMEAGTQNLARLPFGGAIHQDGFESGDLSAWSVPN